MKSKINTGARLFARALLAIVLTCCSRSVFGSECANYYQYIWSGGQAGFSGVLFLDSAYCRYDSSSGLCDLIGPGSYVTTPGGGRLDLWQLQRDRKLQVRATFTSTQLRQLCITQTSSITNGSSEVLTLTQNCTNETLAATAIVDGYDPPPANGHSRRKTLDISGSWIAAAGRH
jgi:hypothetical protein